MNNRDCFYNRWAEKAEEPEIITRSHQAKLEPLTWGGKKNGSSPKTWVKSSKQVSTFHYIIAGATPSPRKHIYYLAAFEQQQNAAVVALTVVGCF